MMLSKCNEPKPGCLVGQVGSVVAIVSHFKVSRVFAFISKFSAKPIEPLNMENQDLREEADLCKELSFCFGAAILALILVL